MSGDVGKVFVNATSGFANVKLSTWQHTIGGYQVLHKWLDDRRKAGRSLSTDDITHWLRVYAALEATQGLMLQVDEAIEDNGGWPGAFSLKTIHHQMPPRWQPNKWCKKSSSKRRKRQQRQPKREQHP